MKIYSSIGSKERLVEMFQRVNNVQLNENVNISSNEIVENAFNLLRNNQLKVLNTNKQTSDNESYVELNCIDKSGTNINFKFRATSSQGELEGVFKIDSAELIDFTQGKSDGGNTFSVDENMLKQFNLQYKNVLVDIVSNYVDFDEDKPESDELYEEAVKVIDNAQYNGGERLQKHRTYVNEKPTNSNAMVNSSEFEKNEEGQDDDDPLVMPNDYDNNELDKDLGSDYDDVDKSYMGTLDAGDDADESTPEEQELYNRAFENLMAKNKTSKNLNYYPTRPEIEREIERLESINKSQEPEDPYSHMAKGKKRVYPAWADKYLTENPDYASDVQDKYYKNISPEVKRNIISRASKILDKHLGEKKNHMPKEMYYNMIRRLAKRIYFKELQMRNESEYPSSMEIPKVIEPKKNYPAEQKKRHKIKKLKVQENDGIEKLAQNREEQGDQIKGGLGDDKSPLEFDPEQIKLGMKVEMEHSDDPMIALEITLDHLTENPEYYTVRDDPEASAQANASMEAGEGEPFKHSLVDDNEELTDELLGYKPKNVGEMDEDIVGANGAEPVVGGQSTINNNDDDYKKYQDYQNKNFNNLPDNDKEEYFGLWRKYKK